MHQKLLKSKIERLIYLYFVLHFPNQPSSQKNNKCYSHEKKTLYSWWGTLPYLYTVAELEAKRGCWGVQFA
jgi:hypothetical protein